MIEMAKRIRRDNAAITIMNITATTGSNPVLKNFSDSLRQRFQDFKALGTAIESGDLTSAQTALAAVQKDIQNDPRIAKSAKSDQITKDLAALGDAIKSGDTTATKQAFATLTQDLKGLRHGRHAHKADNDGDKDDGGTGADAATTPTAASSAASLVGSSLNAIA